jgi:hypothetical protein
MILQVFKGLFALLLVLVLLCFLFPATGVWCIRNVTTARSHLLEEDFIVPEADLRPTHSIKDYYAQRDDILLKQMMTTRKQFQQQPFIGSVHTDGFHASLPPDAKWKGGIIEVGASVRQQVEEASTKVPTDLDSTNT